MNTIFQVSKEVVTAADAIRESGKSPWFVVSKENELFGPFVGRAGARASGEKGTAVAADKLTLTVPTPALKTAAPVSKDFSRKSAIEKPCQAMFNLADEMKGARRKDVLAAAEAMGIARYTARTQYQQWFQVQKEMAERETATAMLKSHLNAKTK